MADRIPLHQAWGLATAIRDALERHCDRIEIVGSVRRARPDCGDVDIVCIPSPGESHRLRERALARSVLVKDGPQTLVVETRKGVQVDIWFARAAERELMGTKPSNWGTLVVCRTGSMRHNIWLATRARSVGMHWQPHEGVIGPDGDCVACETEEAVYAALGLMWIPPAFREAEFLDQRWDLEQQAPVSERTPNKRESEWIGQTRARLAAISHAAAERFDAALAKRENQPD